MKRAALFAAYAGLDRSIYALFVGSTVIWTLGEILSATNSSVYIANLFPMSHRGRFNAIAPLIMGDGFSTGPWLTGLFIERFSIFGVWPPSFGLALLGALALLLLHARENRMPAMKG